MKVLLKKFKKCNKIQKFFYIFSSLLYLIGFIFFTINILKLKGVENGIRAIAVIFFSLWFFLYLLSGLVCMISKRNKTFIFTTTCSYLAIIVFFLSSFVVNYLMNSLNSINKEFVLYTTNLIALNDKELTSESRIGMINNKDDIEGYILANKLKKQENLNYEIVEYDDYFEMVYDMYEGTIDGLFVSSNFAVTFAANEKYQNIADEVKVLYSYSEKMENQDNIKTNKKLTEPFTMLIMGVDSTIDGLNANQAFNGDTLILVTFNPKTLTATMLSIPRDMYVPISCRNGRYDKINSSAAYGSKCVIDTVEDITDIEIDYYLKINFQGVVDLIDRLGGVTVNVESPDINTFKGQVCEQDSKRRKGEHLICMNTGIQKLNGEQALAYARCRHLYLLSDIDRNSHQQDLIEATLQELKNINSIDEIKSILDVVSKNIDSNMTSEQILSFYSVCKEMLLNAGTKDSSLISIKKSYLEYYNLPVYLQAYNMYTSALGYYQSSMDAIIKMMKVNLEIEEAQMIKTFSIDYNENYESKPTGKGITDSNKLETLPSFIGESESYVRNWCESRGISITVNEADSLLLPGTVVDQGLHVGVFVKNMSHLMIYVSNGKGKEITPEQPSTEIPNIPEIPDIPNMPIIPDIPNEVENEKPSEDDIIIDNEE